MLWCAPLFQFSAQPGVTGNAQQVEHDVLAVVGEIAEQALPVSACFAGQRVDAVTAQPLEASS